MNSIESRNERIYQDFLSGKKSKQLEEEYELSQSSIKRAIAFGRKKEGKQKHRKVTMLSEKKYASNEIREMMERRDRIHRKRQELLSEYGEIPSRSELEQKFTRIQIVGNVTVHRCL